MSVRIVFAVLAALLALAPAPAYADYFGAIAYNSYSGAYGYSFDYGDRYGAEQRALSECGGGCSVAVWFRNACGALATGPSGWGAASAGNRGAAESTALSYCARNSYGCYVKAWACTTR